jgi:threonine dehydratase
VPIGLGSGICGVISTRDALGRKTKVVGVVAAGANAYRRSVSAGRVVPTASAFTFADGMAVRVPDLAVLEVIQRGAERVIEVCDDEIAEAIRINLQDDPQLCRGCRCSRISRVNEGA